MANSVAVRRTLCLGVLAFLVATVVAVRAGDAVETLPDKKQASQEPDSDVSPVSDDPLALSRDVSEIDELLSQSLTTNENLDKEVAKVNAWKYATYGSLAAAGLGGLLGVGKALYNAHKGGPISGKGHALNFFLAGLVLAGVAGIAASHAKKVQAEKKLKAQAKELLGQRQAMLAKLGQLKDAQLEKVLSKAEEIGNIAEDLGLFAPEIESADKRSA